MWIHREGYRPYSSQSWGMYTVRRRLWCPRIQAHIVLCVMLSKTTTGEQLFLPNFTNDKRPSRSASRDGFLHIQWHIRKWLVSLCIPFIVLLIIIWSLLSTNSITRSVGVHRPSTPSLPREPTYKLPREPNCRNIRPYSVTYSTMYSVYREYA